MLPAAEFFRVSRRFDKQARYSMTELYARRCSGDRDECHGLFFSRRAIF